MNICNPLSMCAVLTSLDRMMDFKCAHSFDDTSFDLNGWEEKPVLLTTPEALAWLQSIRVGLSIIEEKQRRRMVQMNIGLSFSGSLVKSRVSNSGTTISQQL